MDLVAKMLGWEYESADEFYEIVFGSVNYRTITTLKNYEFLNYGLHI